MKRIKAPFWSSVIVVCLFQIGHSNAQSEIQILNDSQIRDFENNWPHEKWMNQRSILDRNEFTNGTWTFWKIGFPRGSLPFFQRETAPVWPNPSYSVTSWTKYIDFPSSVNGKKNISLFLTYVNWNWNRKQNW